MSSSVVCGVAKNRYLPVSPSVHVALAELDDQRNADCSRRILALFPQYKKAEGTFLKVVAFSKQGTPEEVFLIPARSTGPTPFPGVDLSARLDALTQSHPRLANCTFKVSTTVETPQFGSPDDAKNLVPHFLSRARSLGLFLSSYTDRLERDAEFRQAETDWILFPLRTVHHSRLDGKGHIYSGEQPENVELLLKREAGLIATAKTPIQQLLTEISMRRSTEVKILSAGCGTGGCEAFAWAKVVRNFINSTVRDPEDWTVSVVGVSVMPRHLIASTRPAAEIPGARIRFAWSDLLDARSWLPEQFDICLLRRSLHIYRNIGDGLIEAAVDRLVQRLPIGGVFICDHEIEDITYCDFTDLRGRPPLYFEHEGLREVPATAAHTRFAFGTENACAVGFQPTAKSHNAYRKALQAGYGPVITKRHGLAPSGVYVRTN